MVRDDGFGGFCPCFGEVLLDCGHGTAVFRSSGVLSGQSAKRQKSATCTWEDLSTGEEKEH